MSSSSGSNDPNVARMPDPNENEYDEENGETSSRNGESSITESEEPAASNRGGYKTTGLNDRKKIPVAEKYYMVVTTPRSKFTTNAEEVEDWVAWNPLNHSSEHYRAAIEYFGKPRAVYIMNLIKDNLHPSEGENKLLDFPSIADFVYNQLFKETGLIQKEQVCVVVNILSRIHALFDQLTEICRENGSTINPTSFDQLVTKLHNLIHLCCLILTEQYKRRTQPAFGLPWRQNEKEQKRKKKRVFRTIPALCFVDNERRKLFDAFLLLMLPVLFAYVGLWTKLIKRKHTRPSVELKKKVMYSEYIGSFVNDFTTELKHERINWDQSIEKTRFYSIVLCMIPIMPYSCHGNRIGYNLRTGGEKWIKLQEEFEMKAHGLHELVKAAKTRTKQEQVKALQKIVEYKKKCSTESWRQHCGISMTN